MFEKPVLLSVRLKRNSRWSSLLVVLVLTIPFSSAKSTEKEQYTGLAVLNSLEAELKTSPKLVDRDGDGLSDFQEIHKYLTDPAKKDTDGDGVPDGDWNERREYTYSVRSILRFMPPFDKAALNDDFQDARVLKERADYIELEVIHYPFSTASKSVDSNPDWQRDYAHMTEYLRPGVTTNWDAKMRQDLLAELRADGIMIDKLTDKQVVKQVSSWLMKKTRYLGKVFTTYYIHFPNAQPCVYPGLEGAFEGEFNRDKNSYDWTIDQHLEHELLGKGMFYNKTRGACTSSAVYLTTVLRALGIPTRMIIVTPAVDASNREQFLWVKERITHNKAREIMLAGLIKSSQGFTAHTFNEVYVGNRWHRLNYSKLGQPVLDEQCFGLHTHLYTFNDLSEANLAPTWGLRYGKGIRSAVFEHSNPYSAVTLSELFGCHGNIPNPSFTISPRSGPPNIYVMGLSRQQLEEVFDIVKDGTSNKTGRFHRKQSYDDVFIYGIWGRKPGDIIVLLFSLDTSERIPKGYEDLLPKPWSEIEPALKQRKTVELTGKARKMNVILLAAPKREQLRQLIQESKLLRFKKKEQIEEHKPSAGKTRSTPHSDLPNIFIMSPSSIPVFADIIDIVKLSTKSKTGRSHSKESYDEIFDGTHNRKSGDLIVLLFSLNTNDRIPTQYEDLLPKSWLEIEVELKQGKTVELKGKARDMNIILLAAPKREQLKRLIKESKLLRLNKADLSDGRTAAKIQHGPGSTPPNIYIMSPSGFNMFPEIVEIVRDVTSNKTGRPHDRKSYDSIFIEGIWGRKPGDIILLLFSLETDDRVPTEYEDLLPVAWPGIESALKQGKSLEIKSDAREMNIIVLAAPTTEKLGYLVRKSSLLKAIGGKDKKPDVPLSGEKWTRTGRTKGAAAYTITINQDNWRKAAVNCRIVTDGDLSLWMNNNGAPQVPNGHASFVRNLKAVDSTGKKVPIKDYGQARWKIAPADNQPVSLSYEVLLEHDKSDLPWGPDEAPYVTEDGAFWTGRALFIVAEMNNVNLRFDLPDRWHMSTQWQPAPGGASAFSLKDADELTEAFIFAGTHIEERARVGDMEIALALGTKMEPSKELLKTASQKLLNCCVELFGGTVPGRTLIVMNRQEREHSFDGGVFGRSVSMLLGDEPNEENIEQWAPFTAHEVLHLWNGQA
ncbi:MAG: M61 family metallopeptidase, partial [Planctomycetota bacterium]